MAAASTRPRCPQLVLTSENYNEKQELCTNVGHLTGPATAEAALAGVSKHKENKKAFSACHPA